MLKHFLTAFHMAFQDWLQYEEITDTEETGEYFQYQHMPGQEKICHEPYTVSNCSFYI